MRLINVRTLDLEEYFGDQIPGYGILSHVWRDEEVSYQDWQIRERRSTKRGYHKIRAACLVCRRDSLNFLWVDTNCINKDSSAELSEAINSMFIWYQRSTTCYVYLDDYHRDRADGPRFSASRWFTRGWTLQELLAPSKVRFFDASWTEFGTRQSLLGGISRATSIQPQYLLHPDSLRLAGVARRMSWVATRSTTREEDMAYCLLGLFEINMPLLYGEGKKAFIRLQEEIIKNSNEHTIFCWSWPPEEEIYEPREWQGCLAPSPLAFRNSGNYVSTPRLSKTIASDFQLTNSGLHITLPLLGPLAGIAEVAVLNACDPRAKKTQLCLFLEPLQDEDNNRMLARKSPNLLLSIPVPQPWTDSGSSMYLAHERDPGRILSSIVTRSDSRWFEEVPKYAILPVSSENEREAIARAWRFQNNQDTIVALERTQEADLWVTELRLKLPSGPVIIVDFAASIPEAQSGDWNVVMRLRSASDQTAHRVGTTTQNLSLSSQTEFQMSNISARIRPVWISTMELQALLAAAARDVLPGRPRR